jgi:toxin secretion/phage lysis holin
MFTMMALDMVTGVIVAFEGWSDKNVGGRFSSGVMFRGLTKKMMIIIIVVLANALDRLMGTAVARSAVIGFYCLNEGMSIIENAAVMGVPFPAGLLNSLKKMRDKYDNSDPYEIMTEEEGEALSRWYDVKSGNDDLPY